jgi:hypothetical protein
MRRFFLVGILRVIFTCKLETGVDYVSQDLGMLLGEMLCKGVPDLLQKVN